MSPRAAAPDPDRVEEIAHGAARWLLRDEVVDPEDPSLYRGTAGILRALQDARLHFGEDTYDAAIERGLDQLTELVPVIDDASLHFGLTGMAMCLQQFGRTDAARRALTRVAAAFDGWRWNEMFELLMGNAGVGLGALAAGDLDLAVTAVEPYRDAADRTARGVNWAVRPSPPRSHHMAHGTLGIAYALAAIGEAADRTDLVELAVLGAEDVVARNVGGPSEFLVPHSDPPHRPDIIERFSYGWCNGPAGDAQLFRLLRRVTGEERWIELQDRCWTTVVGSGLPERRRPGFWDNNGRCCGTAGVLATASDRIVERGDDFGFADTLAADLVARADVDRDGARWSNTEHRTDPPQLPPQPGWAMGSAGILPELLRYVRLRRGTGTGYALPWPDQPTVDPARSPSVRRFVSPPP